KATVFRKGAFGVAAGLDLRMPTGDEYNFLGSGAAGVKPFVALSTRVRKVSPHLNFSYQWNGDSVLAGDPATGHKERLPSELGYTLGADCGVNSRLTIAADVIGQRLHDASEVYSTTFTTAIKTDFPEIAFRKGDVYRTDGSVGFKVNVFNRLLL